MAENPMEVCRSCRIFGGEAVPGRDLSGLTEEEILDTGICAALALGKLSSAAVRILDARLSPDMPDHARNNATGVVDLILSGGVGRDSSKMYTITPQIAALATGIDHVLSPLRGQLTKDVIDCAASVELDVEKLLGREDVTAISGKDHFDAVTSAVNTGLEHAAKLSQV